jgi:hypothetical protein
MLLPEPITTEEFHRALERLALSPGEITGASPATVKRHWAITKAWLYRALTREAAG